MRLLQSSPMRRMSTTALKTLREITGAPLIDCKNALTATQGDVEKARAWIGERNKAVAAKISGRIAKQGLVGMALSETAGALVEINCETDFVARGEDFQGLTRQQALAIMTEKPLGSDAVTKVAGRVRENIVLGGVLRLACPQGGLLGSYLHNAIGDGVGSSAAIVSLSSSSPGNDLNKGLARALAVQVVGTKPPYIHREQIPAEVRKVEEERILAESADALKGKPEKAKEGLLKGKMQKYFAELCLMDQTFILGDFEGKLVRDVLPKNVKISGFIRMSVGGDKGSAID